MPTKSARELWLHAVKSRTGTMNGVNKKGFAQTKKTPAEYWVGSLRKGPGTLEIGTTETFASSKRPPADDVAYLSTSHHLREKVGAERGGRRVSNPDPAARPSPGTPAYKSPEEYYDEVLELRRQLAYLEKDSALVRARMLRVEQDNQRKDKELEQLLDPGKSDDLRRALSDRRPESSAVVHSMKQRMLKLEQQLKDKETALNTLKSNLKNTRVEELTVQMEMMYQEIVRLQSAASTSHSPATHGSSNIKDSKETTAKIKALNDTILRMNEKNVRLTLESKTLKEDLEKLMTQVAHSRDNYKPEDRSRDDLSSAMASLEKKLAKNDDDRQSNMSDADAKRTAFEGKLALEGTLAQRLDMLDKRETELLAEIKKLNDLIKRLKEDRQHYRQKADERGTEVKTLHKEVNRLTAEIESLCARDKTKTPPPKSPRPSSARHHDVQEKAGSRSERSGKTSPADSFSDVKHSNLQRPSSARSVEGRSRDERPSAKVRAREDEEERQQKIDRFTREHAAKKLQSGWLQYQQRKQDSEADKAASLIQSTLRGNAARQAILSSSKQEKEDRLHSVNLDSAATLIQSALRAHASRKTAPHLEKSHSSWSPRTVRAMSTTSKSPRGGRTPTSDLNDDEISDGVVTPRRSSSRSSSRNARSPAKDDDDDDDDIVF